MYVVLSSGTAGVTSTDVTADGTPTGPARPVADLAAEVVSREASSLRWVFDDTSRWYPRLLRAGVRIDRCVDLRLSHAIIRHSQLTAGSDIARASAGWWDGATPETTGETGTDALFDLPAAAPDAPSDTDPVAEFTRQRAAVARSSDPPRLALLLAAESAGALAAAEMAHAGLPWSRDLHERLLEDQLGPRPADGVRPARMTGLLERIRAALGSDDLNPDSPPELLKALRLAGIQVSSTRSWELRGIEHPAIAPLLAYKKLARLLSANGWHWLEQNVSDGRFHPDYVPGGVVTGRWASKGGGGALQLPKQVRGAVVADAGWSLVVADAAQLEPRILAALAGDRGMAEAGASGDLYAGIVASGAIDTRERAKVAMLGAMYGATSGEAGRLLPRLTRSYPRAIALVEEAARAGERGEVVTTRLGRSSPGGAASGYDETASSSDLDVARGRAKAWGRFTRNFVVQGTAAEWALCWMAALRGRLHDIGGRRQLTESPHLVFFLHDELVVHTPAELSEQVATAIRETAADAGRLLFGTLPVAFPVTIAVVADYGQAK